MRRLMARTPPRSRTSGTPSPAPGGRRRLRPREGLRWRSPRVLAGRSWLPDQPLHLHVRLGRLGRDQQRDRGVGVTEFGSCQGVRRRLKIEVHLVDGPLLLPRLELPDGGTVVLDDKGVEGPDERERRDLARHRMREVEDERNLDAEDTLRQGDLGQEDVEHAHAQVDALTEVLVVVEEHGRPVAKDLRLKRVAEDGM